MQGSFKNYRFENLDVWQIGMRIVGEVYKLIKKFPREELFGLSDQIRRASVSIVLNIAEGSGQSTGKSFAAYLRTAQSSVLECVSCLKIAEQEGFINKGSSEKAYALLQEEYFKLIALEKVVRK